MITSVISCLNFLTLLLHSKWLFRWLLVERLYVSVDAKYMFLVYMLFCFCLLHVFSFGIHFWNLQCIFKVKLSMSSLKKKMCSFVPNNCHLFHPLARIFFQISLFCLWQNVFKRYYCGIFCLYMKKKGIFLISVCALFLIGLLLSILYKQVSCSFQLSAILDCPLN